MDDDLLAITDNHDRDRDHLVTLLDKWRRNLRIYELKEADLGMNVPIELDVSIRQAKANIEKILQALQSSISPEVAEEMGPGGRFLATTKQIDNFKRWLKEWQDRESEERQVKQEKRLFWTRMIAGLVFFHFIVLTVLAWYVIQIAYQMGNL